MLKSNNCGLRDWGEGERNWHLWIRDLSKHELVGLIETIKAKYSLNDLEINELVINLKNPLDKRVSGV